MFHVNLVCRKYLTQVKSCTASQDWISLYVRNVVIVLEIPYQLSLLILEIQADFNNFATVKIIEVDKQCTHLVKMDFLVPSIICQRNLKKLSGLIVGWNPVDKHSIENIQNEQIRWSDRDILGKHSFIIKICDLCELSALVRGWFRNNEDFSHFVHGYKVRAASSEGFIESFNLC